MHLCEQTQWTISLVLVFKNFSPPSLDVLSDEVHVSVRVLRKIFSSKSHIDPNILDIYLVAARCSPALCSFAVATFIHAAIVLENGSNLRVFLEIIYDFLYDASQFHTCGDLCAIPRRITLHDHKFRGEESNNNPAWLSCNIYKTGMRVIQTLE